MSAPILSHRGYSARVEFSPEDDAFVGHLLGITDIVGFHAETVAELRAAFVEAVDFYVDTCLAEGREPQKPASGRLVLRLPVGLHHRLRAEADRTGKSLNALIVDRLESDAA